MWREFPWTGCFHKARLPPALFRVSTFNRTGSTCPEPGDDLLRDIERLPDSSAQEFSAAGGRVDAPGKSIGTVLQQPFKQLNTGTGISVLSGNTRTAVAAAAPAQVPSAVKKAGASIWTAVARRPSTNGRSPSSMFSAASPSAVASGTRKFTYVGETKNSCAR